MRILFPPAPLTLFLSVPLCLCGVRIMSRDSLDAFFESFGRSGVVKGNSREAHCIVKVCVPPFTRVLPLTLVSLP